MEPFEKRKQDCLKRLDKSNIGNWDDKIRILCEKINKKKDYYTTSSCSGRVVLVKNEDKKESNKFLFRSHDKISFNWLKKELKKINNSRDKEIIYFKQEPCILHVACRNLESAKCFLSKAKLAGWKRSGIMSINDRVMLELMSTETICFPAINKGEILAGNDFLKLVVKESNKKLEKSWEKIKKLEKKV